MKKVWLHFKVRESKTFITGRSDHRDAAEEAEGESFLTSGQSWLAGPAGTSRLRDQRSVTKTHS